MSRGASLIKNTVIFAIGNFGSKVLQFILLPLYTHALSKAEYGTVDVLQNLGTLIVPIISLTIFEAVFRYAMEKSTDKKEVFSVGILITAIGTALMIAVGFILTTINVYPVYTWIVVAYAASSILQSLTAQFVRAIGKVKLYTINTFIQTLSIILINIVLILVFHMGIEGYMLGYIIGNFLSCSFLFLFVRLWSFVSLKSIKKSMIKTMLLYSIPLIPNAICWWITATIGRFMVTGYLGADKNGLFAVACRMPAIVTIVVGVFIQAWQMSANDEFQGKDFADYNKRIFKILQTFTFLFSACIIMSSKLIMSFMDKSYYEAWMYVPILIVGICFFTFAQFLGSIYTASKKTVMAFVTNLLSAITNIILNIILIPKWGVMGAAVSIAASYLIFWLSRIIDTSRIVKMHYPLKLMIPNFVLIFLIAALVMLSPDYWIIYIAVLFACMLAVNFKVVLDMIVRILGMVQNAFKKEKT